MGEQRPRDWRRLGWIFEWPTIATCAVISIVLGYIGFAQMYEALGEKQDFWGKLYPSLQLFVMESGAVTGPVTWPLQVARFLAPAVTLVTAAKAFAVVFGEQVRRLRLRLTHGHTVVCGLGRKGLLVTEELRRSGERVVVVERDESDPGLLAARDCGALVLLGDAAEAGVLRRAGLARARRVLAVCGDDGVNATVAVHAPALCSERRSRPLDCVVHIVDGHLCRLLKEQELRGDARCAVRLEFFNAFDLGARVLLRHHPPFDSDSATGGVAPHIVVVGCGTMGSSLVGQAARQWWQSAREDGRRLTITIVDLAAATRCDAIRVRWPRLAACCDLVPVELDVTSPQFERGAFLEGDRTGRPAVGTVYVCLDDDARGLTAALAVHASPHGRGVPIVVRTSELSGLARLTATSMGGFENLSCFPVLAAVCMPERLFAGTHETLARAMHEEYVADQLRDGATIRDNAALVPWEQLADDLRESNLREADHIVTKLAAVGCDVAPMSDWDAEDFLFTPDEVERMAEMEHARWMSERLAAGWSYDQGPKDPERKTNPFLVPWDDLPEDERENDREAVRDLPRLLGSVGLQVVRAGPRAAVAVPPAAEG